MPRVPRTRVQRALELLCRHPAVRGLSTACGDTPWHLVGGALRDRALGLPVHDLDAVVAGHGREIAEILARELPARLVHLGGKDFAAFRLVAGGFTIDLWDRDATSLDQDLARRDFTVNSFAFDPKSGAIVDPFGGLDDVERRQLRATTDLSFTGDPLRVLRLPRLLLQLPGFVAEPRTLTLAKVASPRLSEVASERVRDELALIVAHPEAHRGVALLVELSLYPGLFVGRPGEPSDPGDPGSALAEIEALTPALRKLPPRAAATADSALARWTVLFAPLPRFQDRLAAFRDAGYITRREAAQVARLLELPAIPTDAVGRRRFIHRLGALWPTATLLLMVRSGADPAQIRALAAVGERDGEALIHPPRLLSGEEVQQLLGLPPGPEIGRALASIEEAQIDGRVTDRDAALRLIFREWRPGPSGAG